MWQRFTERARKVVFYAQEEAGRLGENYVSTEHLLLGLVRENDSVAARILDRIGVSLGRIRSEIERQVDAFIDKFEPELAQRIRDCRAELRSQLPGATLWRPGFCWVRRSARTDWSLPETDRCGNQ